MLKTTPSIEPNKKVDLIDELETLKIAQENIDYSISKTIILDENSTKDDINKIIQFCYQNKIKGIRAAVCSEPYSAKLSKQHNNSNIIAFGARVVGVDLAKMIVKEWIEAQFEGGRHLKRVELISKIENGEEI